MKKYLMPLLSILILACFFVGMQSMNTSTKKQAYKSLDQAMNRAINECYAREGQYPESQEYIEKNYHVIYDHDVYTVKYEPVGANIRPTYTIIEK